MKRRTKLWLGWGIPLFVTVALIATIVLLHNPAPPSSSPTPTPTTSLPQPDPQRPVIAVKIDNAAAARPHTGLNRAAVLYVEPVEGGLTRLIAIYKATPPPVIGPVRSARATDIELLAQYGKPILAYSGAAPELLPALRKAAVVNASPEQAAGAFFRNNQRPAPHNLYLRPERLPKGAKPPAEAPLEFGKAPSGGISSSSHTVRYRAATFRFDWSPNSRRWVVSVDGQPMTSTESGRLSATTVIEQKVPIRNGAISDVAGNNSPTAQTTGQGKATVFREGKRFAATWSRPKAQDPTRFRTSDGKPLPLASGPVWILLTPA